MKFIIFRFSNPGKFVAICCITKRAGGLCEADSEFYVKTDVQLKMSSVTADMQMERVHTTNR